jgi:hypothetical protein
MGQIIDPSDMSKMTDEDLLAAASDMLLMQETDLKEYALHYYKPANETVGRIHALTCGTIGIFGGNGSGKTEHALVEGVIRCTGRIPDSLKATYPREKLRGPIHMRVVCESITAILEPIILPKLQYWSWSGLRPQGGLQGHWGWIPRHCLLQGDWKKSYNTRTRMLSLRYLNPDTDKFEGLSTIQFMSYDQDPENFASGDVHYCIHDEPPPFPIWRENRARIMRGGTGSTMLVSMTWPDNPASPVDWIFDEIYDKGMPGKLKNEDIEVINIFTTMNPHMDQDKVAESASLMTKTEKLTRIFGMPIRFSNRIHPDFTNQDKYWCYECGKITLATNEDTCSECGTHEIGTYNNVESCDVNSDYPCICLLDPHPRKPHFLAWVQVTPNEDYEVVATLQVEGGAEAVRDEVKNIEERFQYKYITRIMDPNMGASPSGAKRELTWQTEFDNVGLHFDLGDDSNVGRSRLNDHIKPDRIFRRTRFRMDPSCDDGILQMMRYVWADHKNAENKDIAQEPLKKHDDFPTLFKYLFNYLPSGMPVAPSVYKRDRSSADYKIKEQRINYHGGR